MPYSEKQALSHQVKMAAIERAIRAGEGVVEIIARLHTSARTVARARSAMARREGALYCACGRSANHKGTCSARMEAQRKRKRGEIVAPVAPTHRERMSLDGIDAALPDDALWPERNRPTLRERQLPVAQSSFIAPITKAQLMARR